jgi:pimeloyl-ACP methyl ester carboxylesterase
MATYVLIHGAGDSAFHWQVLEPELRAGGHGVVAMDLPCEDDGATLWDYADAVERLGIEPDEIESGHSPALSRPRELAERLEAYRTELGIP